MLRTVATCLTLAVALAAPSAVSGAENERTGGQQEVASLMDRLESNALDVREQAARVRSYLRTPQLHSWELHADELSRISAELDAIADLIEDLNPLKPRMTSRQAAALNHLISLSAEASDATEEAIKIVNTEREKLRVGHPDYETKVETIYDRADSIVARADDVEDWADFLEDLE